MTHTFPSMETLNATLASVVAGKLSAAIEERGMAYLLVSGGSTPIGLFDQLSTIPIAWAKVQIGLVDERFVPTNHEKSNEKLVHDHLMKGFAASARFTGMVYRLDSREENLREAARQYSIFDGHTDIVLLGMGTDGHTASLFPGDPESLAGLSDQCPDRLLNTTSPESPRERISCSKPFLLKGKNLYLMISGVKKRQVLEKAADEDLPIAAFLAAGTPKLNIYQQINDE